MVTHHHLHVLTYPVNISTSFFNIRFGFLVVKLQFDVQSGYQMPFDPSLSTYFHCICFKIFMFNEETESYLSYGYKKALTIYIHSLLILNDLVLGTTYWCLWELRRCDNGIDCMLSEWEIPRQQKKNSLLDCHSLKNSSLRRQRGTKERKPIHFVIYSSCQTGLVKSSGLQKSKMTLVIPIQ